MSPKYFIQWIVEVAEEALDATVGTAVQITIACCKRVVLIIFICASYSGTSRYHPGESPRSPTRDDIDTLGRPAWPWLPDTTYPASPWVLYKIELKGDEWDGSLGWLETQKELTRRFNGLSADAKADYEAHSERLRQEAWDTYEQRKRDGKKAF
ncbi:hypothetical protein PG988_006361 [Apiospora saccharicola]